jgi:hypothetical protein
MRIGEEVGSFIGIYGSGSLLGFKKKRRKRWTDKTVYKFDLYIFKILLTILMHVRAHY